MVTFFALAAFVISVFSFLYFRRLVKKRTSEETILANFRAEVNALVGEIEISTDRNLTLLGEESKRLRKLLDESDKKFAFYSRDKAERNMERTLLAGLSKQAAASNTAPDVPELFVTGAPLPTPSPAPDTRAEPDNTAAEEEAAAPVPLEEAILRLAESGMDSASIAAELGISVTEADLAISLHERAKSG
jgi:hypothetical protein